MNTPRLRFYDLPEDVQVLLFDIVGGSGGEELLPRLEEHCFVVHELPIAAFPDVSAWTDYRNRTYAEAMVGQDLPPAIICGKKWLDGRHRVWVWRRSGMKRVPCIDLAEIGFSYPLDGIAYLDLMRVKSSQGVRVRYFASRRRLGRIQRPPRKENLPSARQAAMARGESDTQGKCVSTDC